MLKYAWSRLVCVFLGHAGGPRVTDDTNGRTISGTWCLRCLNFYDIDQKGTWV